MAGPRRLTVCGATGFIGRNVAEHFAGRDGWAVTGTCHRRPPFDHPAIRWIQADLTNPADVARVTAECDVLVQAAAVTSGAKDILGRPQIHIADNAVMNSLLFRAAFEAGIGHLVFFSCSIMYHSADTPLAETDFDANRPMHPAYFAGAWNKVYFEKMAEFYAGLGGPRFTALRHSNVYGPHDKFDLDRSHVFGATVTKAMTAEKTLTVWGSGEEARDLLHVSDLCMAVEAALARQPGPFGIYNIGAGKAVPVRELVRKIVAASGRDLDIVHDLDKPTIRTSVALDCAKAAAELGWAPTVGLEDGIAATLDWWRRHYGKDTP
ncbi:NAD(P)-dependent oxidoreductase [Magnetospirillum sp. UT-4]|uniref:NAD-dependent epimerase/dehydratase family protein n=1 Tax=Magnetospirillum sp. UT-4 TaxID=2681467 RepID=UPI001380CE5D|nr:NAD(P)-dependent oxidoreductase [Magnetospirillum sp. UT-4]CAA7618434.1 conserved hypothetical protein [Magnetospirillum sp. UT-4]